MNISKEYLDLFESTDYISNQERLKSSTGTLIVAGGHVNPDGDVWKLLVEKIKDGMAYIAAHATNYPDQEISRYAQDLVHAGIDSNQISALHTKNFKPIDVPHLNSAEISDISVTAHNLYENHPNTVVFMGGDQSLHRGRLKNEEIAFFENLFIEGGTIFTTSASSMALSELMIVARTEHTDAKLSRGRGMIIPPHLVIETHCAERGRELSLKNIVEATTIEQGPNKVPILGMGFDENTAGVFEYRNSQLYMTVVGEHAVHIYDGAQIIDNWYGWNVQGFSLRSGDVYNTTTKAVYSTN